MLSFKEQIIYLLKMPESPERTFARDSNPNDGKDFIEFLSKQFGINKDDYQFVFKNNKNQSNSLIGVSCRIGSIAIFLTLSNKISDSNNKLDVRDCLQKDKSNNSCDNIQQYLKNFNFPNFDDVEKSRRVIFYNEDKLKENSDIEELRELISTNGESLSGILKLRVFGNGELFGYFTSPLEEIKVKIDGDEKMFPISSTYLVIDLYKLLASNDSKDVMKGDLNSFVTNRFNNIKGYIKDFESYLQEMWDNYMNFVNVREEMSFGGRDEFDRRIENCNMFVEATKDFRNIISGIKNARDKLRNITDKTSNIGDKRQY